MTNTTTMTHTIIPTMQPTTTPTTLEEPSSSLVCAPLVILDDVIRIMVDLETEVVDVTDDALIVDVKAIKLLALVDVMGTNNATVLSITDVTVGTTVLVMTEDDGAGDVVDAADVKTPPISQREFLY